MATADSPSGDSGDNLSIVEHLQIAAEHLRAAGRTVEADILAAEAQSMVQQAHEQLDARRPQLRQLQQEVEQLERIVGRHGSLGVRCRIFQGSAQLFQFLSRSKAATKDLDGLAWRMHLVNEAEQRILDRFASMPAVKTLPDTQLVMRIGTSASVVSGGKVGAAGTVGSSDALDTGTILGVQAIDLGDDRLRLDSQIALRNRPRSKSNSDRGEPAAVCDQRPISLQAELRFGQSIVLVVPANALREVEFSNASRQVVVYLITPETIASPPQLSAAPTAS